MTVMIEQFWGKIYGCNQVGLWVARYINAHVVRPVLNVRKYKIVYTGTCIF